MKILRYLIVAVLTVMASLSCASAPLRVTSPDGRISVRISNDSSRGLFYSVDRDGKPVLNPSRLGLVLKDMPALTDGFTVVKAVPSTFDETWEPVWGEESQIRNNYNELRVELKQKKTGRRMAVVFRAFNDGIGFRYEFPRQPGLQDFIIDDELTEFAFPERHTTWSLPMEGIRFYEGIFRELPIDSIGWATTPVTIRTADGTHMAIHEAALTDYAAMNVLATPGSNTLKANLTPWSDGDRVRVTDTRVSPWRTLIIADNAGDMMLSRLMLNLNEPCRIANTSWIKPQRYIGIWWCYHMRYNTWAAGPDHGATTENTKKYMDFAARNGFDAVLVEGWNPDWATYKFVFDRAYPDFDIEAVTDYGRSKGIQLIGHHETGSNITNYENSLDSAFAFNRRHGMHYVKTGYDGTLLDGKERHSSQYGVRHYRKVIETAAKYQVNIDNHEPVIPTGLQRTWPNLMTQEGVRGMEWNAWNKTGGNPPAHTVTLPFTRGLAGPMDYTPVVVDFNNRACPGTRPETTLAKQLALFVILYSPLQMAADLIENYEANPVTMDFVGRCPTDWARTVYPEAEIGRYITVARQAKDTGDWYIGSATGDEARTATISLDFLDPGARYRAIIYTDGPDADWENNPYPILVDRRDVTSADTLTLRQGRSGGSAIRLIKL